MMLMLSLRFVVSFVAYFVVRCIDLFEALFSAPVNAETQKGVALPVNRGQFEKLFGIGDGPRLHDQLEKLKEKERVLREHKEVAPPIQRAVVSPRMAVRQTLKTDQPVWDFNTWKSLNDKLNEVQYKMGNNSRIRTT